MGPISKFRRWLSGYGTVRRDEFGYDAAASTPRRQGPPAALRREDDELPAADRKRLVSGTRNIQRNFTLAGWMIRKHLDYVSTFDFQARTGIPALDDELEAFVKWWSRPANCDVTGRFSLARMIRMAEERRTLDGDVFALKLDDGRVQWIEGDRVLNPGLIPQGHTAKDFVHGVLIDPVGRPLAYAVHRRNGSSFEFERMVPAEWIVPHAFIDRFDQVRGISPMAAAINTLRDVYEGCDYALAKMKVAQLFALAFYREADDAAGEITPTMDENGLPKESGYKVDLGKGPLKLDLEPGDRAEFLESKSPSLEFQAQNSIAIQMAFAGLDIPQCFYDQSITNFSGQRQAILQYEHSSDIKRQDTRATLDALLRWRLGMEIVDRRLTLPRGISLDDPLWEWVSKGVPWIDPLKEINASLAAVGGGLTSRQRDCKGRGENWFEIVDELAQENEYLAEKNVQTSIAFAPVPAEVVNANN